MEILPGVHQIETVVGGRRLRQFFLAAERGVLIDVGEADVPDAAVYPYLDSIGLTPSSIALVIVTHADTDHHGGLAAVRRHSPNACISCGLADRPLIESAAYLLRERYQAYEKEHAIGYPADALDRVRQIEPVVIDIGWVGGEVVGIAEGWEIEIVATPGHTKGHVSVRDLRHNALFCGDAVHGAAYPDVDGRPVLPPNYVDIDDYRRTIKRIRQQAPVSLHGAHWPAWNGLEAERFIADSGDYVDKLERLVVAQLQLGELELASLIERLQRECGVWPAADPIDLAYSVEAHLRSLGERGELNSRVRGGIRVYSRGSCTTPCS